LNPKEFTMSELAIPDLWPADLSSSKDLRSPLRVLKEQATALGRKTSGLVEGKTETLLGQPEWAEVQGLPGGEKSVHSFYLVAPVINYRRRLLQVAHSPIEFYPLALRADLENAYTHQVYGEAEFAARLRDLFGDPQTIRIIQALISQSE
jgi:hypothetical protein